MRRANGGREGLNSAFAPYGPQVLYRLTLQCGFPQLDGSLSLASAIFLTAFSEYERCRTCATEWASHRQKAAGYGVLIGPE
jgi:hypothetical protein